MKNGVLDTLDKRILYELQQDARNISSGDIARKMDVSPSTVRNRLHELEDTGVIRGYQLDIDYEKAGFQLYTKIICTAPIGEREDLARESLDVPGVTAVREIMTGEGNIYINAIARNHDDLSRIERELTDLGVVISDDHLIRNEYACSYHGFLVESDTE